MSIEKDFTYDHRQYTQTEHQTWAALMKMHRQYVDRYACAEYMRGLECLEVSCDQVQDITQLSARLNSMCGWTLQPVNGLVSGADFFRLLNEKIFPIACSIRKSENLLFSDFPDVFHDVLGHVPLLTNKVFTDFLSEFADLAAKYSASPHIIQALLTVYWYSAEVGLIEQGGDYVAYGAAILTSQAECENFKSNHSSKYAFSPAKVAFKKTSIDDTQNEYFSINAFADLRTVLSDLEQVICVNDMKLKHVENSAYM